MSRKCSLAECPATIPVHDHHTACLGHRTCVNGFALFWNPAGCGPCSENASSSHSETLQASLERALLTWRLLNGVQDTDIKTPVKVRLFCGLPCFLCFLQLFFLAKQPLTLASSGAPPSSFLPKEGGGEGDYSLHCITSCFFFRILTL